MPASCLGSTALLCPPDAARGSHFVNLLHMSEAIFRGMPRSSAILRDAAQFRHCVDFCTCQRQFFEGCSALHVNLLHMSEAICRGAQRSSAIGMQRSCGLLHMSEAIFRGMQRTSAICELTAHVRGHFSRARGMQRSSATV